jgi:hypothetical protein
MGVAILTGIARISSSSVRRSSRRAPPGLTVSPEPTPLGVDVAIAGGLSNDARLHASCSPPKPPGFILSKPSSVKDGGFDKYRPA